MTTAEDYKAIAGESYNVDPLKKDPPRKEGDKFYTEADKQRQEFLVYETAADPVSGFQAMAVVPIVNGEPDFSTVFVSYAGTNPDDRADMIADAQSVLGGETGPGSQVFDAQQFALRVQGRLKEDQHSGASIETVGHSLGGFLALLVAAENHWPSTTFNGPDPWHSLSPQAKNWLEEQTALGNYPLTNYVNQYDLIGNLLGNGTGAGIFTKDKTGRGILDYHDLEKAFDFDPDGTIKNATGTAPGLTLNEILTAVAKGMFPGADPLILSVLKQRVTELGYSVYGGIGKGFSRLIVTVDTIGAVGLATSVAGTTDQLATIKQINSGLIPEMLAVLTAAKNAAYVHPFVTEADIENCVSAHRLQVHENIDMAAVDHVNNLVEDHLQTVAKISDGVLNAVRNAAAQDAQWSQVYGHCPREERDRVMVR